MKYLIQFLFEHLNYWMLELKICLSLNFILNNLQDLEETKFDELSIEAVVS
jgi:hypothetical protein